MAKVQKDRTDAKPDGLKDDGERPLSTSASISAASWESSAASWRSWSTWPKPAKTSAKTGELSGLDPQGKLRGVYGFSVKTGIGDQGEREVKIEPFGNIRREPSGEAVVEDVREPLVDVYEEDDHVLVLAEIPGVSKKDVNWSCPATA